MVRSFGAILVLAALGAPLAARAEPPAPAAHPVTYDVPAPSDPAHLSQGWGLFATMSGRSTDIGIHDLQWADDPSVQRHDVEAGYGWRRGTATAVIGYEDHDFGPKYDAASVPDAPDPGRRKMGDSGVLGLSLVLHAP